MPQRLSHRHIAAAQFPMRTFRSLKTRHNDALGRFSSPAFEGRSTGMQASQRRHASHLAAMLLTTNNPILKRLVERELKKQPPIPVVRELDERMSTERMSTERMSTERMSTERMSTERWSVDGLLNREAVRLKREALRLKREELRLKREELRLKIGWSDLPFMRSLLGESSDETDTILVALDTEFGRTGVVDEIGITTLRVREIAGLSSGQHLSAWIPKMSHHHFVLGRAHRRQARLRQALFATGRIVSFEEARKCILDCMLLPSALGFFTPNISRNPRRRIVMIGHSLGGDLSVMMNKQWPLLRKSDLLCVDHFIDTCRLAEQWEKIKVKALGADLTRSNGKPNRFESKSLGGVVRSFGIDPCYWEGDWSLVGVHNASNDAFYTMIAALSFATRDYTATLLRPLEEEPASPARQESPRSTDLWSSVSRYWSSLLTSKRPTH